MWVVVCSSADIPSNGGACIKWGGRQIAVFNFGHGADWYALDNRCPHDGRTVLSRGIVGDSGGTPKVSCPLHKNSFSLQDGQHLGGHEHWRLSTYAVKVEDGQVFVDLPEEVCSRGAS